ncbi:TPA: hypothetical protein VVS01_002128 [Streptococcus pneumoniae]|nr:hypothetical protein [Streptococcus pneumoniae]
MELTLFLENGKLLIFENVTNLKKEDHFYNIITFNYVSVEDGKKKRTLFRTKKLVGLSVDKEDFDVNSLF